MTKQNLMAAIMEDKELNAELSMKDVNRKCDLLIEGFNRIINTLAPAKMVQMSEDTAPYVDYELKEA